MSFPTLNETADIDSVELFTKAWVVKDLSPAWGVGRLTPHYFLVPGGDPIPLGVTLPPRQIALEMVVLPDVDEDGVPWSTPQTGLEHNLADLDAAMSSLVGDGVRTMTVKRASGAQLAGRVMVLGFEPNGVQVSGVSNGVLDILLLDGRLFPVGSS